MVLTFASDASLRGMKAALKRIFWEKAYSRLSADDQKPNIQQ